ncbi:MAG: hypothetical protein L6Q83_02200, partial [Gammaproteobacteria bacterium]|nr:hypothetical protein [Gammaproteobacteria bacterium]
MTLDHDQLGYDARHAGRGSAGIMIGGLNRLIIRISCSGWLFIATTVVFVTSLGALMQIGETFPAVAGGALILRPCSARG